MRRVLIVLCFLLLCFTQNCFASKDAWPADTQRWMLLCADNNCGEVFLDESTYRSYTSSHDSVHEHCRMANVWIWYAVGKDGFFITIHNVLFDFSCRTTQVLRVIEYDKNQKLTNDFPMNVPPMQVIPGSLGEEILTRIKEYDNYR